MFIRAGSGDGSLYMPASPGFAISDITSGGGFRTYSENGKMLSSAYYGLLGSISPTNYLISNRWTTGLVYTVQSGQNDFSEIIAYNRILTDSERDGIRRHLSAKYALTLVP